jgi:hypothetical protein
LRVCEKTLATALDIFTTSESRRASAASPGQIKSFLLGRLLECLLRERAALVFTSYYAPGDLCPDPLYR